VAFQARWALAGQPHLDDRTKRRSLRRLPTVGLGSRG